MSEFNYPADVFKIENINFKVGGVDFLKSGAMFRGAVIQESIESPFVTGVVYIDDTVDLRGRVNLDGTQSVDFSYKPLGDETINVPGISLIRTVNISDDSEEKLTSGRRLFYGIEFKSTGYINSTKAALNKNYKKASPYQVYRDIFGICGMSAKTGSTQPILISHNFFNQRLQDVLSFLFDKIDTVQSGFNSCYMMAHYDRSTGGVNVQLIDEMISTAPTTATFVKYSNQAQRILNRNSILFQNSTVDYDVTKRPYADYVVATYNTASGEIYEVNPPVTIRLTLDGRKIFIESGYHTGSTQNIKKLIHYVDPSNDNTKHNFAFAHKHRLVMDAHMDQHKGMFRIPVNNRIKVGVKCRINIDKRVADPDAHNSLGDRNSGLVLVTGVKHVINLSGQVPSSYMDVEYYKPIYKGS